MRRFGRSRRCLANGLAHWRNSLWRRGGLRRWWSVRRFGRAGCRFAHRWRDGREGRRHGCWPPDRRRPRRVGGPRGLADRRHGRRHAGWPRRWCGWGRRGRRWAPRDVRCDRRRDGCFGGALAHDFADHVAGLRRLGRGRLRRRAHRRHAGRGLGMAGGKLRRQARERLLEMGVVAVGRIGWFVASIEPEQKLLLAWGW